MSRRQSIWAFCAFLFGLVACATTTPMQTASVVTERTWRVGGQLTGDGFCGSIPGGVQGLTRCTQYPDGIPLPELRLNGRRGLPARIDVGVSLQALVQIRAPERPFQFGVTVDGKREWLRISTGPVTHVLSAGLLAATAISGRLSLSPRFELTGGIPVLYGLQIQGFEWVAGVIYSARALFSPGLVPISGQHQLELRLALFRRPTSWGLQLGYFTDPTRFANGAIQLQIAWHWDISG